MIRERQETARSHHSFASAEIGFPADAGARSTPNRTSRFRPDPDPRPERPVRRQGLGRDGGVKIPARGFGQIACQYSSASVNKLIRIRRSRRDVRAQQQSQPVALRSSIFRLRRRIERDPRRPNLLLTEPGVGYRLADESENEQGGELSAPRRAGQAEPSS